MDILKELGFSLTFALHFAAAFLAFVLGFSNHENEKFKSKIDLGMFLATPAVLCSTYVLFLEIVKSSFKLIAAFNFCYAYLAWSILMVLTFGISFIAIFKKKNPLVKVIYFVIVSGFLINVFIVYNDINSTKFKIGYKIAQLRVLQDKISDKNLSVSRLISEYEGEINVLETVILNKKNQNNINSFEQAKQNQQIVLNLSLLQRKYAYVKRLKEIKASLELSEKQLNFLEQQAFDDYRLIKVFKAREAEQIISELNQIIEKYLPDASKLVIRIDESSLISQEQIWQQIISKY